MAKSGGGAKWLKYGCLGCLGILGVLLLVLLGTAGLGWRMAQSQEIEDQVATHEVSPPRQESEAPGGIEGEPAPSSLPQPGLIVLDLSHGDFQIEPGRPGEPLRLEATYDKTAFKLEETFEQPEGAPWIYRVRFRRVASGFVVMLSQVLGGSGPTVRIFLPVDVPLSLDLDLGQGGTEMELGGLWLTSADLAFEQGGFALSFDEPLHAPMDHLSLRGKMGGFQVSKLGNASPRRLDVDFRMGGMQLDLRGRWLVDSEITITSRMSGGLVQLPRNVIIEGLDVARRGPSGEVEGSLPTLSFHASTHLGELEFH